METIKKIIPVILLSILILCLGQSCEHKKRNIPEVQIQNQNIEIAEDITISENLKKSSLDFISKFSYKNRLIEVNVDKKEPEEIIISYSCRGIADFEIKKFKPLFSYKLNDNLFFVYTGAEELLNISFDTAKYTIYNFDICSDPKKATYIFQGDKMQLDTAGQFPEPFSSLPPETPLPILNNKKK